MNMMGHTVAIGYALGRQELLSILRVIKSLKKLFAFYRHASESLSRTRSGAGMHMRAYAVRPYKISGFRVLLRR
jgi:hypothetical protein